MRKLLGLTAALFLAVATAHAGADWHTNIDKAQAAAKQSGKPILLEFHGSNWCPPCKKMKADVFSTSTFKEWASENVVLVDVDFPRPSNLSAAQEKHNRALADKYGIEGFPTFILVSADGTELWRHVGYHPGGPKAFTTAVGAKISKDTMKGKMESKMQGSMKETSSSKECCESCETCSKNA